MNRNEYLHLLGEQAALERMVAETPEDDVLDRVSLTARCWLTNVNVHMFDYGHPMVRNKNNADGSL